MKHVIHYGIEKNLLHSTYFFNRAFNAMYIRSEIINRFIFEEEIKIKYNLDQSMYITLTCRYMYYIITWKHTVVIS